MTRILYIPNGTYVTFMSVKLQKLVTYYEDSTWFHEGHGDAKEAIKAICSSTALSMAFYKRNEIDYMYITPEMFEIED